MNNAGKEANDSDSNLSDWEDLCNVNVLFGAGGRETVRDWNYLRCSEENKFMEQSVLNQDEFKLEYNSTDKWLLEQAFIEIKYILQSVRLKLHEVDNGQTITAAESFIAAMPYQFLNISSKWIKARMNLVGANRSQSLLFTLSKICVYLCCEFKMRMLGVSESSLEQFGASSDEAKQYKVN